MTKVSGLFIPLAILLLTSLVQLKAQEINGRVVGLPDGKPVAFAHVVDSNGRLISVCDLEGRFSVPIGHHKLTFSSIGFKKQVINISMDKHPLLISLEPSMEQLDEVVVVAGENPAHRIIRNTRDKLARNAPTSLEAYKLERYDRLVIGADSGSRLPGTQLSDHLKDYDLLVMESIVEETFTQSGGKTAEVKASRVSGLKDPVFVFLMDQLHSADFYGERISIGGSWYVSPLAAGSLSRYRFVLEDAIAVSDTDSVFTLRFEPRPDSRFDGLQGKMSVQAPDWALLSVTAMPAVARENMHAEIRQLYQKFDGKAWFPVQLSTRLWITVPTAAGNAIFTGEGLSQVKNILINPDISLNTSQRHALVVHRDAFSSDEQDWESKRPDSLSIRLLATYRFMDSIGRAQRLDRRLAFAAALAEGRLRLGSFDFPISSLLRFNSAEGYRPGLEFVTNEHFSRAFNLGMYGAYATRLHKPLWNIYMRFNASRQSDIWAEVAFYDHHTAREAGLADEQKGMLNPFAFRQLFYSSVNSRQGFSAHLNLPIGRINSLRPAFSRETVKALTNDHANASDAVHVTTLSLALRLAPGESFMQSENGLRRLSTPNPLLQAELLRMQVTVSDDEPFIAYQLRIACDYQMVHPFAGTTLLRLETGFSDRAIPSLLEFELPGSYNKYLLFAPFSFGTHEPGTYTSSGFISVYLMHQLLPLRPAGRKFRPQPVLLHNMAVRAAPWKKLGEPENEPFFTDPIAESGLLLNNLLKAGNSQLGAGVMYHWGQIPPGQSKRIIFKLALSFNSLNR